MNVKEELVDDDVRSGKYGNFRGRYFCYSLKQDKIDEFNYLIEKYMKE